MQYKVRAWPILLPQEKKREREREKERSALARPLLLIQKVNCRYAYILIFHLSLGEEGLKNSQSKIRLVFVIMPPPLPNCNN